MGNFQLYLRHFVYYVTSLWILFKSFILAGSHSADFIMWALVYFSGLCFQWQFNFQSRGCIILVCLVYLTLLRILQMLVPEGAGGFLQPRPLLFLSRGRKPQARGSKRFPGQPVCCGASQQPPCCTSWQREISGSLQKQSIFPGHLLLAEISKWFPLTTVLGFAGDRERLPVRSVEGRSFSGPLPMSGAMKYWASISSWVDCGNTDTLPLELFLWSQCHNPFAFLLAPFGALCWLSLVLLSWGRAEKNKIHAILSEL